MLFSEPDVDERALVSPARCAGVATAGTTTAIAAGGTGRVRSSPAPGGEEHRQPTLRMVAATPGARDKGVGILHAPPRLECHAALFTLVLINSHVFAPNDSYFPDFRQKFAGFIQLRC